jgi:hypothetical protein
MNVSMVTFRFEIGHIIKLKFKHLKGSKRTFAAERLFFDYRRLAMSILSHFCQTAYWMVLSLLKCTYNSDVLYTLSYKI